MLAWRGRDLSMRMEIFWSLFKLTSYRQTYFNDSSIKRTKSVSEVGHLKKLEQNRLQETWDPSAWGGFAGEVISHTSFFL